MPNQRSERAALAHIATMANSARRSLQQVESAGSATLQRYYAAKVTDALNAITEEARTLLAQVVGGVHTNPPLVVYGNPPIRVKRRGGMPGGSFAFGPLISDEVHQLKYVHVEDGKPYVHDFEPGVSLYAFWRGSSGSKRQDLYLARSDNQPLWGNFR